MTSTAPSAPASSRARARAGHRARRRPRHASKNARASAASSSAGSARGLDDAVATSAPAEGRERREHPGRVLVLEDRDDEHPVGARDAREHVADAGEVVRAVPDLERRLADALEPARARGRPRAAPGRPCGRGSSDRRVRERGARSRDDGHARRPRPRARPPPTRARRARRARPASDHGQLLRRDLLARRPEHLGVLEGDVGEDDDRRPAGRWSRRAGLRAPPRRRRRRRRPPRTPRARPPSAPRTASRSTASASPRTRPSAASRSASSPPTRRRSDQETHVRRGVGARPRTLGERAAPRPMRVVVVFPFVPTTWIARKRALRVAEARQQLPHAPEPELLGPRAQRLEPGEVASRRAHRARAGTAPASRARPRPPRPARSRRSARSRASPRSARPPSAGGRSRRRGFRSPAAALAGRRRRRSRRSPSGSSTTTPLRRAIAAASRTARARPASAAKRSSASGHGVTISRLSRAGSCVPDLLGHVRHHRVQQREQALERRERGRRRVGVVLVEPRLRSPRRTSRRSRRT